MDLPQPLGPTIATNSPGWTAKDTSSRTSGPSSAYRKDSFLASIAPDSSPGRLLASRTSGAARSTSLISSNSGSAATAETKAPVSWVTEGPDPWRRAHGSVATSSHPSRSRRDRSALPFGPTRALRSNAMGRGRVGVQIRGAA